MLFAVISCFPHFVILLQVHPCSLSCWYATSICAVSSILCCDEVTHFSLELHRWFRLIISHISPNPFWQQQPLHNRVLTCHILVSLSCGLRMQVVRGKQESKAWQSRAVCSGLLSMCMCWYSALSTNYSFVWFSRSRTVEKEDFMMWDWYQTFSESECKEGRKRQTMTPFSIHLLMNSFLWSSCWIWKQCPCISLLRPLEGRQGQQLWYPHRGGHQREQPWH